ncbi:MAG: M48 family metallopeptidase [Candidatus Heimdallarchaeota archaeon]
MKASDQKEFRMNRVRFFRVINAAAFFILTFAQIIIVSWISISQEPKVEPWKPLPSLIGIEGNPRILGFFISINPFADLQQTAVLVLLTAGLQLLLLAFLVSIVFSNKNMIQIYPEPLYGPAYAAEEAPTVDRTVQLVSRMAARVNIKVTKIFVYRKAVPNAFSLDLLPIPFFRRPYLVLNTNVLEILSDHEIEAVIAHELAHVSHGDSLVRLVLSIPRLFLNLAYIFIYLQIFTGILNAVFDSFNTLAAIERMLFLALIYLVVAIVTRFTLKFLYAANHQAEYLADFFSAQLVGAEVLINALIHLGQRSEAMQVLTREIEWLESLSYEKKPSVSFTRGIYQRFPKTQLDEDVAREIAPRLFLEEKLDQLVKNYGIELDTEMRDQLIAHAVPTLLQRRAKYFADLDDQNQDLTPTTLKQKTIDWRHFDSDSNQFLDTEEIEGFIGTLITEREKMVFEHELFQIPEGDEDHPSFRDRILKIFRIYYPDRYQNIVQVSKESDDKPQPGMSA